MSSGGGTAGAEADTAVVESAAGGDVVVGVGGAALALAACARMMTERGAGPDGTILGTLRGGAAKSYSLLVSLASAEAAGCAELIGG